MSPTGTVPASPRDIFVCPVCKNPLVASLQAFACATCQSSYPITNGIPDFTLPITAHNFIDEKNQTWLDQRITTARDMVYASCARQLKGMTFCMQTIARLACSGCRLLEAGMGTGHFTAWMADVMPPGSHIFAFDIAWPMLEIARAKTSALEEVILFRANTRDRLPFPDGYFDIVFLRLAPLGPHGVPNVQAGLALLKPGGWYFEAGWEPARYETPPTAWAIQHGFTNAEHHVWQYWRVQSEEEHAASQIEREHMASMEEKPEAARFLQMPPFERRSKDGSRVLTSENLLIAQKPL
jgi:SAM-dependent methyltransferase